ncbi:hypothetical protein [Rhodococcus sp. B50]|uniref:hypothetical protein n=1 Tax=Rhodococcus sp. B50 TaxID=2682847 RepID=UPI001BD396E7|nr:hypothetical protein [Rhodococcus sp. B50]MBS9373617.1 hypothetical protein [Rhodococcus sp. B50]
MTTNSTTSTELRVAIHAVLVDLDHPVAPEQIHAVLLEQGHRVGGRTVDAAIVRMSSDGDLHRVADGDGRTVLCSLTPIDTAATARDQIAELAMAAADTVLDGYGVEESWANKHRAAIFEAVGDAVEAATLTWISHNTVMLGRMVAEMHADTAV